MTHHRQASPMEIFIMPICYRIAAWIWPVLLVTCITLIIVQVSGGADEDILIGAAFAGFLCFITVMISATACCSVGSVKYIQLPCCISQQQVELIKQDCMMRSPNVMMTAAIMSGMQPNMVVQMQPQMMVPQNQVIQNSTYSINQQIPGVQLSSITSPV
ncbi:Hypothetical_protein [Hexamita inflata]|uniref:Hypothetical_protein n=1 Tax=Hexamita inflata TaxID=28002 RepID=A0ABP1GHX0_9EUKA